jgi:hypothetical protein
MPRELKQTAGALRTRRWRKRHKAGIRVFPVRLDHADRKALIVNGFAAGSTLADIERGIHSLVSAMRLIKLKLRADRTVEWQE